MKVFKINNYNKQYRTIVKAFMKYGLDPWVQLTEEFIKHLNSLNETSAYNVLIEAKTKEVID